MEVEPFIGRGRELRLLKAQGRKRKASLVVCRGRRRIGKSTLIQQYGETRPRFLEFHGLAPVEGMGKQEQLENFSRQLSRQSSLPYLELKDWSDAFSLLDNVLGDEGTVLFLDEISWMGLGDRNFAGKLKIAWDTQWKKHKRLIVVLCGSVSSWLEENILNSGAFLGRVSLDLKVEEMPLSDCMKFWGSYENRISMEEKLRVLAVTGGVPRYLEEIDPLLSADQNIKNLCFIKEGLLFGEFEKIFKDIFGRRSAAYLKIVRALVHGARSLTEICENAGHERSGVISKYLKDLEASGFIRYEPVYLAGRQGPGRLHKYRLSDNYLRFYLKYIEPLKTKVSQGLYEMQPLESFLGWDVIVGLQFENMVLNNLDELCRALGVESQAIVSASPYFQNDTLRREACQVDLQIVTEHAVYICEIKFRRKIRGEVVEEVQEKIRKLKLPRHYTVRPVLIFMGELQLTAGERDYFDALLPFSGLVK